MGCERGERGRERRGREQVIESEWSLQMRRCVYLGASGREGDERQTAEARTRYAPGYYLAYCLQQRARVRAPCAGAWCVCGLLQT